MPSLYYLYNTFQEQTINESRLTFAINWVLIQNELRTIIEIHYCFIFFNANRNTVAIVMSNLCLKQIIEFATTSIHMHENLIVCTLCIASIESRKLWFLDVQ